LRNDLLSLGMDAMSRPVANLNRRRTLARKGPAGEIAVAADRRPPIVCGPADLRPPHNQGGSDDRIARGPA
jgi:hypothetical protein